MRIKIRENQSTGTYLGTVARARTYTRKRSQLFHGSVCVLLKKKSNLQGL